ncbi:MAG: endonuclease III [Phycisphaerales bacterium]|nr:endonuclease III [Phycisphaerales bacterium]
MTKQDKITKLITYFSAISPNPQTELIYNTPFELLIAVILSAQCTDKRVNMVTPVLFNQFSTPELLSQANFKDVFEIIKSISYPNNKAKYIIATATLLVGNHQSQVPLNREELIKLPGVGRKTANVITSVLDSQPNMAVDTHVFRVSTRLGLVKDAHTPLAVEQQLVKLIPKEIIHHAHHWLILHGRYVCKAKNPDCFHCGLQDMCTFFKQSKNK